MVLLNLKTANYTTDLCYIVFLQHHPYIIVDHKSAAVGHKAAQETSGQTSIQSSSPYHWLSALHPVCRTSCRWEIVLADIHSKHGIAVGEELASDLLFMVSTGKSTTQAAAEDKVVDMHAPPGTTLSTHWNLNWQEHLWNKNRRPGN